MDMVGTGLILLLGGLMSEYMKAMLLVILFVTACAYVGTNVRDKHKTEICSIKGKSTFIYGGFEYSCLNGVRIK